MHHAQVGAVLVYNAPYTHLNINFDELQITRSPQEALELYQELTAKGVKMNGFKAPGYENN